GDRVRQRQGKELDDCGRRRGPLQGIEEPRSAAQRRADLRRWPAPGDHGPALAWVGAPPVDRRLGENGSGERGHPRDRRRRQPGRRGHHGQGAGQCDVCARDGQVSARFIVVALLVAPLVGVELAGAQAPKPAGTPGAKPEAKKAEDREQPLTVDADRMERYGKESLVIFTGNVVTGATITIFLSQDRSVVQAGKQERVKAVFYQKPETSSNGAATSSPTTASSMAPTKAGTPCS